MDSANAGRGSCQQRRLTKDTRNMAMHRATVRRTSFQKGGYSWSSSSATASEAGSLFAATCAPWASWASGVPCRTDCMAAAGLLALPSGAGEEAKEAAWLWAEAARSSVDAIGDG